MHTSLTQARLSQVAISYSYFEKDSTQLSNFDFFLSHGIGSLQQYPLLRKTEVVVVNNGYKCTPCNGMPIYNEQHRCCNRASCLPVRRANMCNNTCACSLTCQVMPCSLGTYDCSVGRVLAFLRDASDMWSGERLTLIFRRENVGMDFAAHNVCSTLTTMSSICSV